MDSEGKLRLALRPLSEVAPRSGTSKDRLKRVIRARIEDDFKCFDELRMRLDLCFAPITRINYMPKHEYGSAAYAATQMRRNQKTKVRWFCGLCHVPCKDENGFKCHLESETHILKEQAGNESLRKFKLTKGDRAFRRSFLDYLVAKHFGQTVLAHDVYRELYPLDRPQNIMKDTCWETLGVFIAQLRKEGRVEAHKGVKGWQIRVSSNDFEDLESEDDDSHDTSRPIKKRKQGPITGEACVSTTRNAGPVVSESHSKSTKLSDHVKLNFNFGAVSAKSGKFSSNPTISSAFATESSDDSNSST